MHWRHRRELNCWLREDQQPGAVPIQRARFERLAGSLRS
jgi:hypothetical protein